MTTEYFTSRQAAQYLSISVKCLEKWRSLREGPPYVKLGRSVRYRRDDLDTYMTQRLVKPMVFGAGEGLS